MLFFLGVKLLKNSSTISFFKHVWSIVKKKWKDDGIEDSFITSFENEYIKKMHNDIMGLPSKVKIDQIILLSLATRS